MAGTKSFSHTYQLSCSTIIEGSAVASQNGTFMERADRTVVNSRTTSSQVKDWRQRKADGKDVTTTLVGTRYTCRKSDGSQTVRQRNRPKEVYRYNGNIYTPTIPGGTTTSLDTTARSEAEIKFAKKVRQRTQQWASGQFFGELRETASFLRQPVRQIADESAIVLKKLKHARRKTFGGKTIDEILKLQKTAKYRALVRQLNDLYLSWNYAVKPLASDANDAATAFEKLARGVTPGIRFTATGTAQSSSLGSSQYLDPGFPIASTFGVRGRLLVEDKCEVTIRGAMRITTAAGEIPPLMQFGLDPSSWVPTLWEIIPYSFLLDYFSNIGDVLDAWSLRFIEAAWMNETVRRTRTHRFVDLKVDPAWGNTGKTEFFSMRRAGVSRCYTVSRAKRNNDFAPSFAAELPGFGSQKWINVASLALAMKQARR